MAAFCNDRAFELLPSVFDLLLHNVDGIVDDTSLEKLLTWLSEVSSQENGLETLLQQETCTRHFLENENIFYSPSSLAFGLRLCGIFWRKEEDFVQLESFGKLFTKSVCDSSLWNDGAVRNGWFVGLESLCGHQKGLKWVQNFQDCLSTATNHISDSSMFVAMAARSFIAKFLISSFPGSQTNTDSKTRTLDHPRENQSTVKSILKSLCEKLHLKTSHSMTVQQKSSDQISVLEVVRMLLTTDPKIGQEILQVSGLFAKCVELVKTADEIFCSKFVDVITEMVSSTRQLGLDWEKLFDYKEEEGGLSSQATVLLEVPLVLIQRGFLSNAFTIIAGLAFTDGSLPRCFPACWYRCLYFILDGSITALHKTNQKTTPGTCTNGNAECHPKSMADLAADIIINCSERNQENKKGVQGDVAQLLHNWLPDKKSCLAVLRKILATVEELVVQVANSPSSLSNWSEFALRILQESTVEDTGSGTHFMSFGVYGDKKLLKTTLSALQALLKVEMEVQGLSPYPVFFDTAHVLVQLIKNSQTETTVITAALKALENLLQLSPTHTTELLSPNASRENNGGPSATKRPRLDVATSTDSFASELGFTLHRRLKDLRWEVKDSSLEFLTCLLQMHEDSITQFLVNHNLVSVFWQAVGDCESYVRASAWQAVGQIACNPRLRTHLAQNSDISETEILKKIADIIGTDSEAFPRRRAVECITLWTHHRVPALSPILRMRTPLPADTAGSTVVACISRAVTCAMKDFDWEVKLRALELIESVIRNFQTGSQFGKVEMPNASCVEVKDDNDDDNDDGGDANIVGSSVSCESNYKELFTILWKLGVLKPMLEAVSDCDSLVCEKAMAVLSSLKQVAFKTEENYPIGRVSQTPDGSESLVEDLETGKTIKKTKSQATLAETGSNVRENVIKNAEGKLLSMESLKEGNAIIKTAEDVQSVLDTEWLSLEDFEIILQRLDVDSLCQESACADINVRSEPACMLEDILSAAGDHEENLLDCY